MSRKEHAGRSRTANGPPRGEESQHVRRRMSFAADETAPLGTVSDADREYFARIGEAKVAARRATERPAGSLAVALERIHMIERFMGIDGVATAREHWPDRESHMSFLAAVQDKIAVAGADFGKDGPRE